MSVTSKPTPSSTLPSPFLMGLTLIDFKVATRAAWTELDPTHHVLGCLFHLTQVLKPWVEWTMFRGARLGGFPTLEQLHSSMVNHHWWLQKILLPWPCLTRFFPGALESASASEPPAPAPARGRGARGGRMRRAGGARGRGAAPLFRQCPFWKTIMMIVYLSYSPRAGNTHKFLYQLLPSRGLETEKNELVLCQNRECEGCGWRLRSTKIRTSGSTFIRDIEKERTSGHIIRNKLTA